MQHLFIPFLHSTMIKELGFKERCIAFYTKEGIDFIYEVPKSCIRYAPKTYAPTYQQVEDWLWEEHKIYIELKNKHFASVFEYKVIRGYINPKKTLFKGTESGMESKREAILKAIVHLYEKK